MRIASWDKRLSSTGQDLAVQLERLEGAGCEKVFKEKPPEPESPYFNNSEKRRLRQGLREAFVSGREKGLSSKPSHRQEARGSRLIWDAPHPDTLSLLRTIDFAPLPLESHGLDKPGGD